MLPLRDINPVRTTPVVNYLLIAANITVFFYMNSLPPWYQTGYSLVPTRIGADPLGEAFTVFTSMFMHAPVYSLGDLGNVAHVGGNMLFLWIFGDNVEDSMGHTRYLLFYLAGGIVAATVQMAMSAGSPIPMVGASGAIAAVVGAYMLLYPRAPILILHPFTALLLSWIGSRTAGLLSTLLFFYVWRLFGLTLLVPAWFVAGEFFVMNVLMGVQSLSLPGASSMGGVAVFAHIGGFIAGLVLVGPLTRGRERAKHRAWEGWRPPVRR